jgi:hypothetical protein
MICGATAFIGAVPTRIYDMTFSCGWQAVACINGQRPHIDFASPFEPFMFLISGLGLTMSYHTADGIGYASTTMALVVGTWSFFLGQNRLATSPRIVLRVR